MFKVIKVNNKTTLISQCLGLLPINDRFRLFLLLFMQVLLNILDLFALALIGILGSITISGLNSNDRNPVIEEFLQLLQLSNLNLKAQSFFLSVLIVVSLILKTTLSAFLSKKTIYYLAHKSAKLSNDSYAKLLAPQHVTIFAKDGQETIYKLTTGINSIIVGVIGNSMILMTDISLLIILSAALFYVDAVMAIGSLVLFISVAYSLYVKLRSKAESLGRVNSKLTVLNNSLILNSLQNYRQIYLRGGENFFVESVSSNNLNLAKVNAEGNILPFTSKYFIETSMVVGISIISLIQFAMYDTNHAVSVLAIFVAASMRIMPAVLRIQNSAVRARLASGMAKDSLDMLSKLKSFSVVRRDKPIQSLSYPDFIGQVIFMNVSFQYENSEVATLRDVNLEISPGDFVAFIGASGSGKSTILDLMTGLKNPTLGEISISGLSARHAIEKWPGAVAFVPQSVDLIRGSIKENLSIGLTKGFFEDSQLWEALDFAQLSDFVQELPNKLDTYVSDKETNLSGGQIQRLGIARALLTKPKILILDEATSSLDIETENFLVQNLEKLKGRTTLIVAAHRISTINKADKIYIVENGKVVEGKAII